MTDDEKDQVLNTYTWIKVKKYKDDPSLSWEERYKRLENHHNQETIFLIEFIRKFITGCGS